MNRLWQVMKNVSVVLCLVSTAWAQAPPAILEHIPSDAWGFVVLRNVETTIEKVKSLADRFEMPSPGLQTMLEEMEDGLDKKREVGMAWLEQRDSDDPQDAYTHFVFYFPVSDYATFVEQFESGDAKARITEASFNGQDFLIAKKSDYAIIAGADDLDSLDHVLGSKATISETAQPLVEWMNHNDLTISLSPSGTKLMFAKLKEGLKFVKTGAVAAAGDNSEMVEAALGMYQTMFDAGEKEFTQFAVGLRVDPKRSIELHKRVLLAKDGWLTKASTHLKRPENPISGLPPGPYVVALDGAMPKEWPREMMAVSFDMLKNMQGPDAEALTDEQIKKLSEVTSQAMRGTRSMSFVIGVCPIEEGIYGRSVGVFRVDDANMFMERYEKSLSEMIKLMNESSLAGAYEIQTEQIEDVSALHLTTDMSKFQFSGAEGLVDMKEQFETLFGSDGKLSIYLAPADRQTIVMAYTSSENLLRALKSVRAGDSGLANDTQLKKTANLLSDSAQWVGYVSPGGAMQFATQMAGAFAPGAKMELPEFPPSPPLGFAVELTPAHLDAQLVVPLKLIEAAKEFAEQMQR